MHMQDVQMMAIPRSNSLTKPMKVDQLAFEQERQMKKQNSQMKANQPLDIPI